MSEYQCYEFVALGRPLTAKEMADLRAISTRAEITPTRFWNEYQWGDLKADPAKLVERYFDAHMYFANWGTHRLMLRLPLSRVDAKSMKAYFVGDAARVSIVGDHLILDLHSEDEEPDYDEDSQGSLGALVPLRTELMCGDRRVAYLAWLLAVQTADVAEAEIEPPVPPGLADLTAAQAAMVEFLRIDEDLISAAAEASVREEDDRPALREWALALAPRAKDAWLRRAIDDPNLALGGELLRAFRAEVKPGVAQRRRTVAELLARVEAHRERRERAEAELAAKAKKAAETARNKRLDGLAKRGDAVWDELEALVEKSAYDDAIKLAVDLRDLAKRNGTSAPFAAAFEAMRKRQLRRRGFFDRWKRENESCDGERARQATRCFTRSMSHPPDLTASHSLSSPRSRTHRSTYWMSSDGPAVSRMPPTSRRCCSDPPLCRDHSSFAMIVSSVEATKTGTPRRVSA